MHVENSTALMDPEAYGGKWVLTLCVQHCIPGLMESYAEINYRDVPDIANDIIAMNTILGNQNTRVRHKLNLFPGRQW